MSIKGRIRSSLIIVSVASIVFVAGSLLWAQGTGKSPDYKEIGLFRRVMGIVQKNYVKDVNDKELVQGAINGMLQSL
ncbi:MAG: carboxyl-terminal processing protease, partial [Thermodesulfobacteriota bacterium]|nr:carboxyl-terminal processing protease [Thermodesulfobacteriota bacterium]